MAGIERQFTASALVLLDEKRLVLLWHCKLGAWLYPGGHVEYGETPDDAILRELREEIDLDCVLIGERDDALADREAGVVALACPYAVLCERIDDAREPHDHIDLIYACVPAGPPPWVLGGDARAVDAAAAAALPTLPNFRALLAKVFADDLLWSAASRARAGACSAQQLDRST